jgi:hypothetical protein
VVTPGRALQRAWESSKVTPVSGLHKYAVAYIVMRIIAKVNSMYPNPWIAKPQGLDSINRGHSDLPRNI